MNTTPTYSAADFTDTEKEHANAIAQTAAAAVSDFCKRVGKAGGMHPAAVASTPMAREFFTDAINGIITIVADGRGFDIGRLTAAVNAEVAAML